jgi:polygalacturonase
MIKQHFLKHSTSILLVMITFIQVMHAQGWEKAQEIVDGIHEPTFPNRSFNVRELGAVGDGKHNDLPAIQSAINICNQVGGGRVVVPKGVYWLEGPIHFKSNVNLFLSEGSIIRFSAEPDDFLPLVFTRWEGTELFNYSPFIYANNCTNIAITGSGTIDGNAKDTFAPWLEKQTSDQNNLRDMGDEGVPVEQRILERGIGCGHPLFSLSIATE